MLNTVIAPQLLAAAKPASDADITKSFESHIAQLDAMEPNSPQALETHLRYADYLAKDPGENCGVRLNAAQSQLQAAQRNLALSLVLPQGLARAADIEYQLHTARAYCGDSSDASHRDAELHAALESAQRAAALYGDTFDYPAMVTMQFNAAVTYQSLGDTAAAQTALNAVIDADREFGFRDDAITHARAALRSRPRQYAMDWPESYLRGAGAACDARRGVAQQHPAPAAARAALTARRGAARRLDPVHAPDHRPVDAADLP